VRKAGDLYLVASGYVEAKLAQPEINARLRPAIQHPPTITVLDLVDQFRGAHSDLQRAETFLVALIGNYDLVGLLSVANDAAVEVIVVDLQQDVVLRIGVVKHPLHEVTLCGHR